MSPRLAPVARHGALRQPRPLGQFLVVVVTVLAVMLASALGVAGFAAWEASRTIAEASVDIGEDSDALPPSIGEIEGGVNLLLVGTDSCEGQDVAIFGRCGNDDSPGERNDVTMLVHISDDPRRVTVVSFPRDMVVEIPACDSTDAASGTSGGTEQLNASYNYGGLACTARTIEQLTGEDVQFAAAVRWTGVINISDAIGGVDVCVENGIHDAHTGLDLEAGTHTLQGVEALQFLRTRHGVGDGSDLGRISNQQQFMASLVRKLQSGEVLSDPTRLFAIATTVMEQVNEGQLVLSSSLANPTRMVQIAMAVADVPYEDIVFVQYPTAYGSDLSTVYPMTEDADVLFAALRDNRPIEVTGEASPGDGTVIVGEADSGDEADAATPDATDGATPGSTDDAAAEEERVELPSDITGTSADEVSCSVGNG